MRRWWDRFGFSVSLGCLVALIVATVSVGLWAGRVEQKLDTFGVAITHIPEIENQLYSKGVQDARIETDLQWIKATLIDIKAQMDNK